MVRPKAPARKTPSKIVWGAKPYALQQEVIDYADGLELNSKGEKYRFFFCVFGRQSGKSWLGKRMLLERAVNQHQRCLWVTLTVKTAQAHWNDLKNWLFDSGFDGIRSINEQQREIYFEGGGYIFIRTVTEPGNMRGLTMDFIVMDEAAFYPRGSSVWYSIVMPMITASRGQVLFATTPHGENWVFDLFKKGLDPTNNFYKSWRIPSWEAPYQDPELLAEIKKDMPSYEWREEYGAEFLADSGGVLPGYGAASVVSFGDFAPELDVDFRIAGMDFGFTKDFSTYTLLEVLKNGMVRQVYGRRWSEPGTIQTVHNLLDLCRQHKPRYLFMENNGVGVTIYNLIKELARGRDIALADEFSKRLNNSDDGHTNYKGIQVNETKIVCIHIDNPTKRELVEGTAAAIEYGRLHVLNTESEYGQVQSSEASTFQRQKTRSSNDVTYNAEEECHDDTLSALFLAYRGVPPRQRIIFTPEIDLTKKTKSLFRGGGKSFKNLRNHAQRN